jgi:hypothetical protein
MGTIMAVVAVLLIHIDRMAVGSMKPNIKNLTASMFIYRGRSGSGTVTLLSFAFFVL